MPITKELSSLVSDLEKLAEKYNEHVDAKFKENTGAAMVPPKHMSVKEVKVLLDVVEAANTACLNPCAVMTYKEVRELGKTAAKLMLDNVDLQMPLDDAGFDTLAVIETFEVARAKSLRAMQLFKTDDLTPMFKQLGIIQERGGKLVWTR